MVLLFGLKNIINKNCFCLLWILNVIVGLLCVIVLDYMLNKLFNDKGVFIVYYFLKRSL